MRKALNEQTLTRRAFLRGAAGSAILLLVGCRIDDETGASVNISTYTILRNQGWVLETWDVSSIITTADQVNNMEILFHLDLSPSS